MLHQVVMLLLVVVVSVSLRWKVSMSSLLDLDSLLELKSQKLVAMYVLISIQTRWFNRRFNGYKNIEYSNANDTQTERGCSNFLIRARRHKTVIRAKCLKEKSGLIG